MGWTGVQKPVASNGGRTLVLYNQALDIRVTSGTNRSGWCLAMSVIWVIRDANGESFWEWFGPPSQACPTLEDPNALAKTGPVYGALDTLMKADAKANEAIKYLAAATGAVDLQKGLDWFTPKIETESACKRSKAADAFGSGIVDGARISRMICLGNGAKTIQGYKLLSSYGANGAHMTAARVVDDSVIFMDPNYGEFAFPAPANFAAFMTKFWATSGYQNKYATLNAVIAFTDPNSAAKYG